MKVNVQFQAPTALPSRKHPLRILNGILGEPQSRSECCCKWKYPRACRECKLGFDPQLSHCAE
jgi:hypothetical protein